VLFGCGPRTERVRLVRDLADCDPHPINPSSGRENAPSPILAELD
jgi:hypothetical protein